MWYTLEKVKGERICPFLYSVWAVDFGLSLVSWTLFLRENKSDWRRGLLSGLDGLYYVLKKYGKAVVVFDGYSAASTKDMVHKQRAKGKQGPTVSFTNDMVLSVSKDIFLSNSVNKQNFIQQLGNNLQAAGCEFFHASSDADFLIA